MAIALIPFLSVLGYAALQVVALAQTTKICSQECPLLAFARRTGQVGVTVGPLSRQEGEFMAFSREVKCQTCGFREIRCSPVLVKRCPKCSSRMDYAHHQEGDQPVTLEPRLRREVG